jgi:penicillin-binding protein 1C
VSRRVFGRRVTHLISHILADSRARLPAFGRRTVLDVGFPAAVKTGTSKDFRDNWTVGYTAQVTVGVWVGNFDGASMENVSGISGAGPLWAEVMIAAMRGREAEAGFARPDGLVTRRICPLSGELAGPRCPAALEQRFIAGSEPTRSCSFHREIELDRRNGMLAGAGCPEQHVQRQVMTVYPPVYRAWAHARGVAAPPTTYSPLCPNRSAGSHAGARVSIRFPQSGDRYHVDPDLRRAFQQLPLEATVRGWVSEVRWLVDGRLVARSPYPYAASWTIRRGRHTISAVLPDGARSNVTVNVGTGFTL